MSYLTEARGGLIHIRLRELWVVEDVKKLTAEFEFELFREVEVLADRKIKVFQLVRFHYRVYPAFIAKGEMTRLSEARGIEPLVRSTTSMSSSGKSSGTPRRVVGTHYAVSTGAELAEPVRSCHDRNGQAAAKGRDAVYSPTSNHRVGKAIRVGQVLFSVSKGQV